MLAAWLVVAVAGAAPVLDTVQAAELTARYQATGRRTAKDSFADVIGRVALAALGKPYLEPAQVAAEETLTVTLETLHCVSFVESTLAAAECVWRGTPNEDCFLKSLEAWRYRHGRRDGYASRLHYFFDWLDDNTKRRRLHSLTESLGGTTIETRFNYMSRHPGRYPALRDPNIRIAIVRAERHLDTLPAELIPRHRVAAAEADLQTGDVVSFATSKPGIFITHTGFALRTDAQTLRVLHASSHHGRVVLTPTDLADYVLRRPERLGVLVHRPVTPK